MNISIDELKILLNNLNFKVDERKPPDVTRKQNFKNGWNDFIIRKKVYKKELLNKKLTWQNLGFRLSQKINVTEDKEIDEVFDNLALIYEANVNNNKENNQLNNNLEFDDELLGYEGNIKSNLKIHKLAERDNKFVLKYKKKNKNIEECPGCGLKPMKAFGIMAINFFDLHHITPLNSRKSDVNSITSENDVVLLCPNCHRLIHKLMTIKKEMSVTVDELKKYIDSRHSLDACTD